MASVNEEIIQVERRGPIDGIKFFSYSPFRSIFFCVVTGIGLTDLVFALYILLRYTHDNPGASSALWLAAIGVLSAWILAARQFGNLRALYLNESALVEVTRGSAFDVALGSAVGLTIGCLYFLYGAIFLLLALAYRLLS
jgi:hypothetical protein